MNALGGAEVHLAQEFGVERAEAGFAAAINAGRERFGGMRRVLRRVRHAVEMRGEAEAANDRSPLVSCTGVPPVAAMRNRCVSPPTSDRK